MWCTAVHKMITIFGDCCLCFTAKPATHKGYTKRILKHKNPTIFKKMCTRAFDLDMQIIVFEMPWPVCVRARLMEPGPGRLAHKYISQHQ